MCLNNISILACRNATNDYRLYEKFFDLIGFWKISMFQTLYLHQAFTNFVPVSKLINIDSWFHPLLIVSQFLTEYFFL